MVGGFQGDTEEEVRFGCGERRVVLSQSTFLHPASLPVESRQSEFRCCCSGSTVVVPTTPSSGSVRRFRGEQFGGTGTADADVLLDKKQFLSGRKVLEFEPEVAAVAAAETGNGSRVSDRTLSSSRV